MSTPEDVLEEVSPSEPSDLTSLSLEDMDLVAAMSALQDGLDIVYESEGDSIAEHGTA